MLNYVTHSVLFPLTLPMYTHKLYKITILLLWFYTLNILLLGTFLPEDIENSDNIDKYRVACGVIPFILSSAVIIDAIYTKRYRSLNKPISWIWKGIFILVTALVYYLTNQSKTFVEYSIFVYRIVFIALSGLLVLYLIKNFMYMSGSNNIIAKNNTFMKISRRVQLMLIIFFSGILTLQVLRISSDKSISFTNLIDILCLVTFFFFFNFQLYKRISNNVMLFPLIYKSKNSFIFN